MSANWSDARALTGGLRLALDWRKATLGGLGVLLYGAGLAAWTLSLTGGHALPDLQAVVVPQIWLAWGVGAAAWGLYVFSFFGGAIARLAAVEIATGRRPPLASGTTFARRRFRSFFWSPGSLLLLAGLLTLLSVVGGVIGRVGWGLGPTIVALLYPLSLALSAIAVLLAAGAFATTGLMFGAVAAEDTGSLDASSRSLNMLYNLPWRTLCYRATGWAYGLVVYSLFSAAAVAVWVLSASAVRQGMGDAHEQLTAVAVSLAAGGPHDMSPTPYGLVYAAVAGGYVALVLGVGVAYVHCTAVLQYLVLRRHADGTALVEVALDETEDGGDELAYGHLFLEDEVLAEPQPEDTLDDRGVAAAHP